jgi:membrane protease YdiL (CAAX protease family)
MIMILPGDNMANKYGPIPTNKLNLDGTNFSRDNIWDLSGSNLSKLFQSDVTFRELYFSPISRRKGPLIGDWVPETKIKTWLKVFIVWVITNISLYLVLAISYLLVYGGYIDNLTSLYGLDIIISSFFFTSIILITLYFENKFTYLRNLFSIPNIPKSTLLIILVSVLDAILVFCWIIFYDFITSPSPDLGYAEVANTNFGLILIFISFAITAPIFEEILFRGYLLDKIRSSYSDNFTIISTGLLFGMMHWNIFFWSDFAQVGSATIGGFLYAWLRIKTGSLWPSMICHSLWNGTIFILVFVI